MSHLLQIIDWFEQYAEEFFETHNEIGESLEIAQALTKELMDFEESTKVRNIAAFPITGMRLVLKDKPPGCKGLCGATKFGSGVTGGIH